jgi:tetratricopeptide (TPR) repeat protein
LKTWSDNEEVLRHLFDNAMRLRDDGRTLEAVAELDSILSRLQPDDRRLLALVHLQRGNILGQVGELTEALASFRVSVEASPASELASVALFMGLNRLRRFADAFREAARLLSVRDSLTYREFFEDPAVGNDGSDELARLGASCRAHLERHRLEQRTRTTLEKGDTVRIAEAAPLINRPGSLASVRKTNGPEASEVDVVFADGTPMTMDVLFVKKP